jgi:flagellar basal-body rod protein FlgF
MPYGLYMSAEGAHAQGQRLDVIANNLANVETVGFKREMAILQARDAQAIEEGLDSINSGSINQVGGGIMLRQTKTDFSQGPLKRTNIPKDVAIKGEGFFLVAKGDENMLTRAGNFDINSQGTLVTQQGYEVLSDTGSPITVSREGGSWQITDNGSLQQGGISQNLALVMPNSLGDLVKVGENLFKSLADPQALAPENRKVAANHLEMSTSEPTTEMLAMIEASRILEANINMLKTQDQMLGGLVNRVLKT